MKIDDASIYLFLKHVMSVGELVVHIQDKKTKKEESFVVYVCKFPNSKPVRQSKSFVQKTEPTKLLAQKTKPASPKLAKTSKPSAKRSVGKK